MIYLRRYGEGMNLVFPLYTPDGSAHKIDASFAAGDVQIMLDEGAEANVNQLPVDEGTGYSIALTDGTELSPAGPNQLTFARGVIYVRDQDSPAAWLETDLVIETYGHPNSQHPTLGGPFAEVLGIFAVSAVSAGVLTLATGYDVPSSTDGFYDGCLVFPKFGTGAGQAPRWASTATSYNGTTKQLTLADDFAVTLTGSGDSPPGDSWVQIVRVHARTQAFPSNFDVLSISGAGRAAADVTGIDGSFTAPNILQEILDDAAAHSLSQLTVGAVSALSSAANNAIRDAILTRMGGLVGTVDTANFAPTTAAWQTTTAGFLGKNANALRGSMGWFLDGPAAHQGFFVTGTSELTSPTRLQLTVERGQENADKVELGQLLTSAPANGNTFVVIPNV